MSMIGRVAPFLMTRDTRSGFDPNSVPGLKLWLDPSDTANRSIVSGAFASVTCKKTGLVWGQSFAPSRPILSTTQFLREGMDYGTALVSGSSRYLTNATGVTLTRPLHVFSVVYWGTRSNNWLGYGLFGGTVGSQNAINLAAGAPYCGILTSTNGVGLLHTPEGTGYAQSVPGVAKGSNALAEWQIATTPAATNLYKDSTLLTKINAGTFDASVTFTWIGWADSTYLGNGAQGETLAYEGTLTAQNILDIQAYLKGDWGTP